MWFGVRHVIRNGPAYEERVTLWDASSFDEAIALAEPEAAEYASLLHDATVLYLFQAYELADPPGHGREVFSLIRDSELEPSEYLDRYFDTGSERQSQLPS